MSEHSNAYGGTAYQRCVRCVMDTSDPDIAFDEHGTCNHCALHEMRVSAAPFSKANSETRLHEKIAEIKRRAKGEYDCIVGVSGGVDSSYLAYQARRLGLKPLAVHFDNGWNSELAVKNIERLVSRLDLDLMTFVIDWEEFRDIQRSFFRAHVVDIELVTDHAIFAAMFAIARQHRIRYILSGMNAATESIMPKSWVHPKFDLRNLKAIHRRFGTIPIRHYPTLGILRMGWNHYVAGFQAISILNYLRYRKDHAIAELQSQLGWQYYGGKHYESIFTRFYQAYILPRKFGIDKRLAHLSDLIMNGEILRENALAVLERSPHDALELERDRDYVCKKLGFTDSEFDAYIQAGPVSHLAYPNYATFALTLANVHRSIRYRI